MALSAKEAAALTIIGIDEVMLKGRGVTARTIKSLGKAAVKLSPFVARRVATTAARHPIGAGVGIGTALGLGALETQPGQDLLAAAAERGQMDRIRSQQLLDQWVYENITRPKELIGQTLTSPTVQALAVKRVKRKVSKYSRAIKVGMNAVKKSKFGGKPGKINNAKKVFSTVSKVTSAVNKGKKIPSKGIRGTVARAVRRVL